MKIRRHLRSIAWVILGMFLLVPCLLVHRTPLPVGEWVLWALASVAACSCAWYLELTD